MRGNKIIIAFFAFLLSGFIVGDMPLSAPSMEQRCYIAASLHHGVRFHRTAHPSAELNKTYVKVRYKASEIRFSPATFELTPKLTERLLPTLGTFVVCQLSYDVYVHATLRGPPSIA